MNNLRLSAGCGVMIATLATNKMFIEVSRIHGCVDEAAS
jgi:hypothetical protein